MPEYRVADLLADRKLGLDLLAGAKGLDRHIANSRVQKPGLILAGRLEHLNPQKVQILGLTEVSYLKDLGERDLKTIVDQLMERGIIAFILTKSLTPPAYFLQAADERGIPLLQTAESTSQCIRKLSSHLEKKLAPQTTVHGDFMSIDGVGVLITGKSGIGKSECALDLVQKGHRLVADDVILLERIGEVIVGRGPETIRHHMEIRGLGIINIKDLFGVTSVIDSSRVEMIIELVEWGEYPDQDRLGLEEEISPILDVGIPRLRIPVSPGRNLSVILEVAARNHLLKKSGYNAARALYETLRREMRATPEGAEEEMEEP